MERGASISALGIFTDLDGDGLAGSFVVTPEILVPGRDEVRLSVLATLADIAAGKLAGRTTAPRICQTLDLDLHLLEQPIGSGFMLGDLVRCRSRVVRAGRNIVMMGVELFRDGDDTPFGFGNAGFMASPNPDHVQPEGGFALVDSGVRPRLDRPLAERVGSTRIADGGAVVPLRIDNVNATGALQGGLLAFAAEEAVLAGAPDARLASIELRYLRAFRDEGAHATATIRSDVARVEIHGEHSRRLGVIATCHLRGVSEQRSNEQATGRVR